MEFYVKDIYKNYGKLNIINDFSLDFTSKAIHCILGPSGCGKTTLLNILAGLISAEMGKIYGFYNKNFSCIFQEDRLLPWATVEENVMFILKSIYTKNESQQLVNKYLDLVELDKYRNLYPHELSGGMKQRVAIARAFAYEGDILLMDEPFKGLHLELKKTLMDYIINYWQNKRELLVYVTHDIDEALYMSDEIHIFDGPPLTYKKHITIEILKNNRSYKENEMRTYKEILLESIQTNSKTLKEN
ncbi:ABC transporter ATP-binding protein [Alkaliphilus peptidifermentans]|uniref:NitT/TauT family transport system ATP-binding protein n=1 Tax=Alkaliphilus peptidifermentans DSM 18978 TaxID=1120976 RepID=A0A1G5L267_9FIRM|nr:ABC transporter ATP-binding protein [Alkaliphilus peptidifermentans]SCZ06468.1 NitT/TauT family transport system ATP-binding protein [Alkaliphilus peptidifermentans DSM 18978]